MARCHELIQLELCYLQLKLFEIQWKGASKKHLNGLQAKKLNCKPKSSNCKCKKAFPEQNSSQKREGGQSASSKPNRICIVRFDWVKTAIIPSERVQICARVQIWACLICAISTYSNGAMKIRVGLELAEAGGLKPEETARVTSPV